ncbi:hypothetical protein C6A85_76605, partial [Mycobacterium sp. ITM-2017-0098]
DITPTPEVPVTPETVSAPMSESGHERMPELNPAEFQLMPQAPANLEPLVFATVEVAQHETSPVREAAVASVDAVGDRTTAAINLIASVSEVHAAFVERQAQAHSSFLTSRGALLAVAVGRRMQMPAQAHTGGSVSVASAPAA